MKKFLSFSVFVLSILFVQSSAFAQFDVNWGISNDTGNSGFTDLNNWFSSNGYGSIDAETGYIGHGAADSDPFSFFGHSATFEVVNRLAGNGNLTSFGFYTGTGLGKSLTEVLSAGANGPQTVAVNSNFGVYLNAPLNWQAGPYQNLFSDRAENESQQTGAATNAGGDAQALIYKLNNNQYLLAWDDYDVTNAVGSDRDYNDAYLKVTTTTPEPISMALFGLGAGALGLKRLRRRKQTL